MFSFMVAAIAGAGLAVLYWIGIDAVNSRLFAESKHEKDMSASGAIHSPSSQVGISASLETKVRRARWNENRLRFEITSRKRDSLRMDLWTDVTISEKAQLLLTFRGDVDNAEVITKRPNLHMDISQHTIEITFDGEFIPNTRLVIEVRGRDLSLVSARWWGIENKEP